MSGVQALPNPAAASRLAATRTEALARAELDALRASGPIQRDGGSATPEWPSATQQAMEKQEARPVCGAETRDPCCDESQDARSLWVSDLNLSEEFVRAMNIEHATRMRRTKRWIRAKTL